METKHTEVEPKKKKMTEAERNRKGDKERGEAWWDR